MSEGKTDDNDFFIPLIWPSDNVPDIIVDMFYQMAVQPTSYEEVEAGYSGKLNRYRPPFRDKVGSIFPLMDHLYILNHKIESGYFNKDEVEEAYKNYERGFRNAYRDFKEDIVGKQFSNEQNKAQKIFDHAMSFSPYTGAFRENYGEGRSLFCSWENDGMGAGYDYRAWEIILENYTIFLPLFEARLQKDKENAAKASAVAGKVSSVSTSNIDKEKSEQYIKPELVQRLNDVESSVGIQSMSQIRCAAWVELLMENRPSFFEKAYHKNHNKNCAAFAKLRYGIDITNQMKTAKNEARNIHKNLLKRYLK